MPGLWELKRDIAQIGLDYAIARRTIAAMRYLAVLRYAAKFDPAQPRDQRGRWTGDGASTGGSAISETVPPRTFVAARRVSPLVEAECEELRRRDELQCRFVALRACWAQAYLRYSNCLRSLPIPPLNY